MRLVKNPMQANAVTHNGVFHADDVLATVVLSKIIKDLRICRLSTLPHAIHPDAIVYDLGGGPYDHHQSGGNGQRENGLPYAASGLIWRDYGMRVCKSYHAPKARLLWSRVDSILIQGVDARDCLGKRGNLCDEMTISDIVTAFLPVWDSDRDIDEAFLEAVGFVSKLFDKFVGRLLAQQRAYEDVSKAIMQSEDHILVLEQPMPWQEAVFHAKATLKYVAHELSFVVFPSFRAGYNCQVIAQGNRLPRCSFPQAWLGLTGRELQDVCGVRTASFVHDKGFIAVAETRDDAILMGKTAMSIYAREHGPSEGQLPPKETAIQHPLPLEGNDESADIPAVY